MNLLNDTFPTIYHMPKMEIMLRPREVNVLTYPNGAHMTFGTSSPRVMTLDVYGFDIHVYCKRAFRASL